MRRKEEGEEMRIAEGVTAVGKQSLITLNYSHHINIPHISIHRSRRLSLLLHTAMDLDDLSKYNSHGHSSPPHSHGQHLPARWHRRRAGKSTECRHHRRAGTQEEVAQACSPHRRQEGQGEA